MSAASFLRRLLGRSRNVGGNVQHLVSLCEALLGERGEVSGAALARQALAAWPALDQRGREEFFDVLAKEFAPSPEAVGKAAALPGVLASHTELPVIGVPIRTSDLGGLDSLLSIVQMPSGVPVACVAINGARNAAILAAQILRICWASAGRVTTLTEEAATDPGEAGTDPEELGPDSGDLGPPNGPGGPGAGPSGGAPDGGRQ